MWAVFIFLLPAAGMGVYFFGLKALHVIAMSTVSAIVTEFLIQKWRKVEITAFDGSAAVTGLLLALTLPSDLPVVYAIMGSVFAIAIGKQVFGGLGKNIWNPALVGRAFLQVSFATEMNTYNVLPVKGIDTVSGATPLAALHELYKAGDTADHVLQTTHDWIPLAWGNVRGCLGETSAIAIILGGLFLIGLKVIDWRIAFTYIGTAVFFCWALPVRIGGHLTFFAGDPAFHALSGGLMLGGFFMITDMVTSAMTVKGKLIYAAGGGLLVALIRLYGGYPEGVCYSILIMNTAVPLIDKLTFPKPFGTAPKPKEA